MKLLDEKKFLTDLIETSGFSETITPTFVQGILSKHLKDIKDEPHHPSGMDRDKIKIRNELRKELRG